MLLDFPLKHDWPIGTDVKKIIKGEDGGQSFPTYAKVLVVLVVAGGLWWFFRRKRRVDNPYAALPKAPVDPPPGQNGSTKTFGCESYPSKEGLRLVFRSAAGDTFDFCALRKPLGMQCSSQLNTTVVTVDKDSHANDLGIKSGLELVKVNDQDVSTKTTPQVQDILKPLEEALPLGVPMTWRRTDGHTIIVNAYIHRLDEQVTQKPPFRIAKEVQGGSGKALGLALGWAPQHSSCSVASQFLVQLLRCALRSTR